ncbi:HMG box-containing protein 4 isoform X2 [Lingula anatina]|uniref:HMG box-containing protein 4 isoform X2 n=1 Tax=Lingula anatina TaxID=7574 RepID=A0A1S3HQ11_LINAN|nr:HMG box-containing protein 4 isoform X2 [Lingula anatina]|eukprot:XP_013388143.1 HMG box-containing protein 4 isoform X2 [Lingula anatina]
MSQRGVKRKISGEDDEDGDLEPGQMFVDGQTNISRSGRVRKKSAKLLGIDYADPEEVEKEFTKPGKGKGKAQSPRSPRSGDSSASSVSELATHAESTSPSMIKLLLNKANPPLTAPSKSPVSSLLPGTGFDPNAITPKRSKGKKAIPADEDVFDPPGENPKQGDGDLKLKIHLGSSPSVQSVGEQDSKSSKKKNKKEKMPPPLPLDFSSENDNVTIKEGDGLKLKLILSPNKEKPSDLEPNFDSPETAKQDSKKSSKKGKQAKSMKAEQTALDFSPSVSGSATKSAKKGKKSKTKNISAETPSFAMLEDSVSSGKTEGEDADISHDSSTVVSYADFMQSMQEEEEERKLERSNKKKKKKEGETNTKTSAKKKKAGQKPPEPNLVSESETSMDTYPEVPEPKSSKRKKQKQPSKFDDSSFTLEDSRDEVDESESHTEGELSETQDEDCIEESDSADALSTDAEASNQEFAVPAPPDTSLYMKLKKPGLAEKKKKKGKSKEKKARRTRAPTAYTLWCSSYRQKIVAQNPGIDFANISKRLGEIWQALPEKEKTSWRRKAKKLANKGTSLISTGKPMPKGTHLMKSSTAVRHGGSRPKAAVASAAAASPPSLSSASDALSPYKVTGTSPLDAAAHLKLLGESLSIIGTKLHEHRGHIAVQGSLSVLLDSMICALGPLLCLTAQLPETNGSSHETQVKILDNIAYIMPGL